MNHGCFLSQHEALLSNSGHKGFFGWAAEKQQNNKTKTKQQNKTLFLLSLSTNNNKYLQYTQMLLNFVNLFISSLTCAQCNTTAPNLISLFYKQTFLCKTCLCVFLWQKFCFYSCLLQAHVACISTGGAACWQEATGKGQMEDAHRGIEGWPQANICGSFSWPWQGVWPVGKDQKRNPECWRWTVWRLHLHGQEDFVANRSEHWGRRNSVNWRGCGQTKENRCQD